MIHLNYTMMVVLRPMGMGGMILFQLPPQMESISLMVGQM